MNQVLGKVYIVDDDESVRHSLSILLRAAGYRIEAFGRAEDFLSSEMNIEEGCIILDIFLKGKSGLELQEEIAHLFKHLPIIYITGQGDIPMSVTALKKGAINFLTKPVDDKTLLDAVNEALEKSAEFIRTDTELRQASERISSLTERQYQIFRMLITGMLNKQIAAELNITEHTVKLHRGKITEKLGVKSVAEMVHLAEKLHKS